MICEIINPSDPYTLDDCGDFVAAGWAVAMLGNGLYGLECKEAGLRTPVLAGWPEWIRDNNIDDRFTLSNAAKLADIFDTVLPGGVTDRPGIAATLAMMPEEGHAAYLDNMRSSMNDIGRAAKGFANKLREVAERQSA